MKRLVASSLIGVLAGMLIMARPAQADGGLVDSAHRMAVALERIATVLERGK